MIMIIEPRKYAERNKLFRYSGKAQGFIISDSGVSS